MNKKTIIIIVLAAILLILTVFLFFLPNGQLNETSSNSSYKDNFVVKYHNQEVVLFNNDTVIERFEGVNFNLLPVEDRLLLEEGITVSSIADAHSLIEDYDG